MSMPLSGCSFGWLHLAPLPDALRALARHGFGSIELTTAPPHLSAPTFGPYERHELTRLLNALGLPVLSVNPSFADINLVSTNPEFRELSERQLLANIELAADLGAEYVVVIPGRRHALAPAPDDAARAVLDEGLDRLLARADQVGVTLALKNSPYGYLGRASDPGRDRGGLRLAAAAAHLRRGQRAGHRGPGRGYPPGGRVPGPGARQRHLAGHLGAHRGGHRRSRLRRLRRRAAGGRLRRAHGV